ncbi:MAG: heme-binding protein, partial [Chloroflexi bacterium]|nr:heme-binding protein [Chloroflexota bacterium]
RAYSAGVLERSTSALNQRMIDGAPDDADRARLVADAGGIPIGRPYVIAGIGVAGGTPEQDHECARAALAPPIANTNRRSRRHTMATWTIPKAHASELHDLWTTRMSVALVDKAPRFSSWAA